MTTTTAPHENNATTTEGNTMTALRLLELQTEFINYEDNESTLANYGMKPERSREDIAHEYEQCLRKLLAN